MLHIEVTIERALRLTIIVIIFCWYCTANFRECSGGCCLRKRRFYVFANFLYLIRWCTIFFRTWIALWNWRFFRLLAVFSSTIFKPYLAYRQWKYRFVECTKRMSTLSKIQHFWYEDCTSANAQAEEYLEFSRTSVMEFFFVAKTVNALR